LLVVQGGGMKGVEEALWGKKEKKHVNGRFGARSGKQKIEPGRGKKIWENRWKVNEIRRSEGGVTKLAELLTKTKVKRTLYLQGGRGD